MNWLGFQHKESTEIDIPLFPLGGVLFPGGVLSLKVFEQRYLDMAATCMKDKAPFGICLISSGREVGESAVPHRVGTLAHIDQADMPQLGILMLTVRGGRRFRILSTSTRPDGLLRAQVELLALTLEGLTMPFQRNNGQLGYRATPDMAQLQRK